MKKKTRHQIFSFMLAISMLVSFMIVGHGGPSYAETTVEVSSFAELQSAIGLAAAGDTIEIAADMVVEEELVVERTLNIAGRGHTLSVPVPGLDESGTLNTAPSPFRVFKVTSGTLSMQELTIKGGAAVSAGSGLRVEAGAVLKLEGVTVSNCGGSSREGGGIANYGTAFLVHCNIIRNGAAYGGGFLNEGSQAGMFIENCSFSENRSLRSNGGGGAGENKSSARLYVNNSTFSNNTSTELGGAINNYNGEACILNSTFTGNANYSSSGGGALRVSGTVYLVNNIFAYNFSSSDGGESYRLNDFNVLPEEACFCLFHGQAVDGEGNVLYEGVADGSDDSLFTGGSTSQVLGADGKVMGAATVYQPYLARLGTSTTSFVPLCPVSQALLTGVKTGFTNGSGEPVAGYRPAAGDWVDLVGDGSGDYEVTSDQNGQRRASSPARGAVETVFEALYMVKVHSVEGGTVRGGTVYGDTYGSGAEVTLTAIPDHEFKFKHWIRVADSAVLSADNPYRFTVTESLTLAPVFEALATGEYIITYVGNENTGGEVPPPSTHTTSAAIAGNTGHLTRTGYLFDGWNTRGNGSGHAYAAGDPYEAGVNLTLYAQWERGCEVFFDSQGGSSVPPVTVAVDSPVPDPGDPTRAGWEFTGWFREPGGINRWDFVNGQVSGDLNLYGQWIPIPAVFTGGSLPEGIYGGEYQALLAVAGGSGSFLYQLVSGALPPGLELSADGEISGRPAATGDSRFTVQVTDRLNGESARAELTLKVAALGKLAAPLALPLSGAVDYGHPVELTAAAPGAAIYYTTNGETPGVTSTLYTGPLTLFSDTTIKAVAVKEGWEPSAVVSLPYTIKTYAVSYHGNGAPAGSPPSDPGVYKKGDSASVRGNPGGLSRTGFRFTGWNTRPDQGGTHYDMNDLLPVREDTVLYAEWALEYYTVTFLDWDGKVLKTQRVAHGKGAAAPAGPERAGHDFTGWDKPFGRITADTRVTAGYLVNRYTLTFDPGDGRVSRQSLLHGERADRPEDPQRDGYLFDAWYADEARTRLYDFDSPVTRDMTLYAGWFDDALLLQQAAMALTLESAFRFAEGDRWECVTGDFELAGQGAFDTKLAWSSSNTDLVQIRTEGGKISGMVRRPQGRDANTLITATLSRGSHRVTRTFLLIVKEEGVFASQGRALLEGAATAQLGDSAVPVTFYRTSWGDGSTTGHLFLSPETMAELSGQGGADQLLVSAGPGGIPAPDAYTFEIPRESLSILLESGRGLTLSCPAGSIRFTAASLEAFAQNGDTLYVRVLTAEKEAGQAAEAFHEDLARRPHSDSAKGQVRGLPWIVETNGADLAARITLPLSGLSQEELADPSLMESLSVYLEHGDGTEFLDVTLLVEGDRPGFIGFDTSRFGRFQIVSLEKTSATSPWWWILIGAAAFALLPALFSIWRSARKRSRAS